MTAHLKYKQTRKKGQKFLLLGGSTSFTQSRCEVERTLDDIFTNVFAYFLLTFLRELKKRCWKVFFNAFKKGKYSVSQCSWRKVAKNDTISLWGVTCLERGWGQMSQKSYAYGKRFYAPGGKSTSRYSHSFPFLHTKAL